MAGQKEKAVCKTGELCKFDCPQVGFYHPRSNLSQSVVHSVVVFGRLEGQGTNGLILNNFFVIIFQFISVLVKLRLSDSYGFIRATFFFSKLLKL